MKKISIFLAVLTIAAMFAMPTNAASEILIGTPELDGVIDEMYYRSASYTCTTENKIYNQGADYSDAAELKATTYYLYDEDYVYMVVEVTDATPNYVAEDKIKAGYQWMNDVCEFWVSQNDVIGMFNFDAAGYGVGIGTGYETTFSSTSVCEGASTQNDTGYIVEVKFPNELKTGDTIKLVTQVNNALDSTFSKLVCIGAQDKGLIDYTLSDEEALIEVVDDAPVNNGSDVKEVAASTADPISALVALAIAGAGVIVCKKNRK